MSIALVTAAFKTALPTTPKFVLVALCDIANDQGECFPGVPLLMTRCSMAQRTVQGALNEIERGGYLLREFRSGRATLYTITPPASWPDPGSKCGGLVPVVLPAAVALALPTPAANAVVPPQQLPPAVDAPPQHVRETPAATAPPPPQLLRDTPAAHAPITVKEPSSEPSGNQKRGTAEAALIAAELPDVRPELVADWITVRKAKKAPLTKTAIDRARREADKAGLSLEASIEYAVSVNWQAFDAKWYAERQGRAATRTNGRHYGPMTEAERDAENARTTAEAARLLFGAPRHEEIPHA